MKKTLLLITLAAFSFVQCAQQPTTKAVATSAQYEYTEPGELLSITYDDDLMREAKAAYQAKNPAFMKMFNEYKQFVDKNYLNSTEKPRSITDRERDAPPSGDHRDPMSLSPYWWPDPDSDDGLPYIRHDGVRNVVDIARYSSGGATQGASDLAFMYFLTGDEAYAERGTAIMRAWYLDPEKGVNPNIVFAQFVPGMQRIRGTGLLAAGGISGACNTAKLLEPSQAWTDEDEEAMQDWAAAFLYWMEYSTHGQEEHKGGNNHAMWYEANRQAIALYTKEYAHLAKVIREDIFPHLSHQIAADSSMPHELARSLGLHYHTFTFAAITRSSIVANKIGINDLWTYTGSNGRGVHWTLEWVIPYWFAPETWPYQQIRPESTHNQPTILLEAGKRTGNQKYIELANEFAKKHPDLTYEGGVGVNDLLYFSLKQ